MRLRRISTLVGAALVGIADDPAAQQRLTITGPPTCATCRIQTTVVATLGRGNDATLLALPGLAIGDGRGGYYVVEHWRRPDELLAYAASGAFRRRIGRGGSGPGELNGIGALSVRGDSIHVFADYRETVFTYDGRLVRTRALLEAPYIHGALMFADGSILLQASIPGQRGSNPFHVLGSGAQIARSFGTNVTARYHNPETNFRQIALAGAESFWSAELPRYRVELWTANGELKKVIDRRVDWFPTRDPLIRAPRDARPSPPPPTTTGVSVDERGRLWVLVRVADAKWSPDPTPIRRGQEVVRPFSPLDNERTYDTYVEVIDVNAGTVLVSQRLPGVLNPFPGPGMAKELVEDADGVISMRILRLSIASR